MKTVLLRAGVAGLMLLSGCCGGTFAYAQAVARYRHDGAAVLPDSRATRGAADPQLLTARLCDPAFHTATARDVTETEKKQVCARYGATEGCPGNGYEIDHLISIELGGSNDIVNLWPQPVDARGVIGFHTKDVVENRLHKLVCANSITLAAAQKCIAGDWYACARRLNLLPAAKRP